MLFRSLGRLAAQPMARRAASNWAPGVVAGAKMHPHVLAKTNFVPAPAIQQSHQLVSRVARAADFSLAKIEFKFIFRFYQDVLIAISRNLFQSFRPILLMAIMGNFIKAFAYGVFVQAMPLFAVSAFYSFWMFEMAYTFLQMFISFVFIGVFYNNLYFRGRGSASFRRVARCAWRQGVGKLRAKHSDFQKMRESLKRL